MTNTATSDWRSEFRLHTLDLGGGADDVRDGWVEHWMLQDDTIRGWIGDVAADYESLIAVGGDPFNGALLTVEAVIAKLGFADRTRPSGFFATAKFTATLVAATISAATGAQRETIRLRRNLRAKTTA